MTTRQIVLLGVTGWVGVSLAGVLWLVEVDRRKSRLSAATGIDSGGAESPGLVEVGVGPGEHLERG